MQDYTAIAAWVLSGLSGSLLLLNLGTAIRNRRGGRYRSAIMFVPTIFAGLAVAAGMPWWVVAIVAPLDIGIPFIGMKKGSADAEPR